MAFTAARIASQTTLFISSKSVLVRGRNSPACAGAVSRIAAVR